MDATQTVDVGALDLASLKTMNVAGLTAIAGVVLLVDARHPGLDADLEASRWFSAHGCAVQLVATKADKLSRAERGRAAAAIAEAFGRTALMTSVTDREGIDALWAWIAQQVDQWTQLKR